MTVQLVARLRPNPGEPVAPGSFIRVLCGHPACGHIGVAVEFDPGRLSGSPRWCLLLPVRYKEDPTGSGIWAPAKRIRRQRYSSLPTGPQTRAFRDGKRAKKGREVIEREVPAIVSVEVWERAQERLHTHRTIAKNAKRCYLLWGLIVCDNCGLNYSGTVFPDSGGERPYYRCNGEMQHRGLYGAAGKKCPGKSVRGDVLENAVWADVEGFLRDPGPILEQLAERTREQDDQSENVRNEIARLPQSQQAKQSEKDAVIALYRRGRIDASTLDRQLDQIQQEETHLRDQIEGLHELARSSQNARQQVHGAAELLTQLRGRLDEPLTPELKHHIIKALVDRLVVKTRIDEKGKKHGSVHVTYRFDPPDERAPSRVLGTSAITHTDIREATPMDAQAIAHVHVASWRTTYQGIVPEDVLAGLSEERRAIFWSGRLDNLTARECLYVAEDQAQGIVGFAHGGPESQGRTDFAGELYAIYLLAEHQGQGLGRALTVAVVRHLAGAGMRSMLVWVVADNPSRAFYAAMGGREVSEKSVEIGGKALTEIAYGWDDIGSLLLVP